jgi:hypothetical protein
VGGSAQKESRVVDPSSVIRHRPRFGARAGLVIGAALALVGVGVGTVTGVSTAVSNVLVTNTAAQPVPVALAAGSAVSVNNLPATQAVSGTVTVGNLPKTQDVSGTVNVATSAANPISVVDETAAQSVGLRCGASITNGNGDVFATATQDGTPFSVPAGQRLVIEEVSGDIFLPLNQVPTLVQIDPRSGGFAQHYLILTATPQGADVANSYFTVSEFAREYANPGTTVECQFFRNDTSGDGRGEFWITGYLAALP